MRSIQQPISSFLQATDEVLKISLNPIRGSLLFRVDSNLDPTRLRQPCWRLDQAQKQTETSSGCLLSSDGSMSAECFRCFIIRLPSFTPGARCVLRLPLAAESILPACASMKRLIGHEQLLKPRDLVDTTLQPYCWLLGIQQG